MALGATPKVQLDSLPLISAVAAQAPDNYVTIGNKVSRYWSPASTGISAVNFAVDPELGTASALFTNFLDFTGMNEYVALLVLSEAAATALHNIVLRIQYRTPGGVTLPHSGTTGQGSFTNVGNRTPNAGALGFPLSIIMSFPWTNPQGGVTLGADARLWFAMDAFTPVAGQLFDCHVYAGQS
jgi:hypothetical protein